MKESDKIFVRQLIENYCDKNKKVPFVKDLEEDASFGVFFKGLNQEDRQSLMLVLHDYIEDKIATFATKGGELFRRFYNVHSDIFWDFRNMNDRSVQSDPKKFQEVGKKIEEILFTYEGILTEKMLKRPEGLDKTIDAFYDIVYMFFPLFGEIG